MSGKTDKIKKDAEKEEKDFQKAVKTQMSHIFGKPVVSNPNLVNCSLFAFNIAKGLNK